MRLTCGLSSRKQRSVLGRLDLISRHSIVISPFAYEISVRWHTLRSCSDEGLIAMKNPMIHQGHGPFQADQLRSGDPYELSNGHPIQCLPTGGRGSKANLIGGLVLGTDPDVDSAGVDTGYAPTPGTLRAPDVAVGNVPDLPGWVAGAPPLALEYADTGQDEDDLALKITELLAAGTRFVWVVRLTGPRRVEVHQPGTAMRVCYPGDWLEAPGILRNKLLVESLYDPQAAATAALRNLLQRQGYRDLDDVRGEGRTEGAVESLRGAVLDVLDGRGMIADAATCARLERCVDPEQLRHWLRRAATLDDVADLFEA